MAFSLQMYVLPVASEIKPVKNQMTAVIGHDLRKHTYDYSRADEVLKSLGVSNNLKLKDRKTKDEKKKAQQVEPVEVWCPGNHGWATASNGWGIRLKNR